MAEGLIFILDSCVWINLLNSLKDVGDERRKDAIKKLKKYRIITSSILKDEIKIDHFNKKKYHPHFKKFESIYIFIKNLETPDSKSFNPFFFETYPKIIRYLDDYYQKHKQKDEKHYLRKTNRQATLSDGDLSMVLLPFLPEYRDSKFVILTADKLYYKPSPNPSTKELTAPRYLLKLLQDQKIVAPLPSVGFTSPSDKLDNIEDIIDAMEAKRNKEFNIDEELH